MGELGFVEDRKLRPSVRFYAGMTGQFQDRESGELWGSPA